ncbi:MAG: serine/threonine-protein kinase [Myxococcales bacterium]|nr:protein kinase [Polyangiaceae bacterium]MDW8249490.1 serine/threonine-protein kinase [Myxococcales bacterium]
MARSLADRDGLTVGSLLNGKYRLLEQIGSGGMGKIYKAVQLPLERIVAVKVVHPYLVQGGSSPGGSKNEGETFQKRFFREASALSQLRHRHIVTVFDYGQIEGRDSFFMVMEFLQGAPLSAQLRGGQRMAPTAVLDMLRQVGKGLREVHRSGMVHRDLKPANIFLAQEGEEHLYKLLDFGLVKQTQQAGDPDELTEAGALLGSPTYMAPEQIEGGPLDCRADIYSLGAMAFHCLAGKPPFEGSLTQVMLQHVHKEAPTLSERCPEGAPFPPELERLLARCLAKRPADRYQSLDELFEDLWVCEARYGVTSPQPALLSGSYPGISSVPGSGSYPGFTATPPGGRMASPKPAEELGSLPSLASAEAPTRPDVPAPSSKKNLGLLVVAGVGAAMLVGGVVMLRPSSTEEAATKPLASTQPAPSYSAPNLFAEAPARPVLRLHSIPEGAHVSDGERELGVTPLELPLEGLQGKKLSLKLDGFEPFILGALPSESTRMDIPLKVAEDRPSRGSKPHLKSVKTAAPTKMTEGTAEPPPPPPPAIRMTR